jgi:RNA polymerase-binding transcription factor DksA
MTTSEAGAGTQFRLYQTEGRIMLAIKDALTLIRHEKFGILVECGEPISKSRLEALLWARRRRDRRER